jgi:carbon storage regulator
VLVLSRKLDEQILIGDDVVLTVVRIEGDKVKIGIEAPIGVRVDREEVRAAAESGMTVKAVQAFRRARKERGGAR